MGVDTSGKAWKHRDDRFTVSMDDMVASTQKEASTTLDISHLVTSIHEHLATSHQSNLTLLQSIHDLLRSTNNQLTITNLHLRGIRMTNDEILAVLKTTETNEEAAVKISQDTLALLAGLHNQNVDLENRLAAALEAGNVSDVVAAELVTLGATNAALKAQLDINMAALNPVTPVSSMPVSVPVTEPTPAPVTPVEPTPTTEG